MSAIAGILHFNNEPVNPDAGMKLMQSLSRYPADAVQTWQNQQIFLGCHAQWITPESIGEQLPLHDYEKQLVISSDAIIDNRNELFERLQVHHALRKEMPDSQIILLSYEKWGEDCPKYLVGDFAFMIWDEKKRKLFGARDFSGCRTLYYTNQNHRFAFCTAMKPLLTLDFVKNELNEQWLADFLAIPWNFESVDLRATTYNNIEQLPPSHTISIIDGKMILSRYLTLRFDQKLNLKSNEEYEEAFLDVFKTAVSSRLRTHRNIGAHLSGGLDSGSVSSFAARSLKNEGKSLYTYSYVPAKDFIDWTPKSRVANEKPNIQATAQYAGNIKDHYFDFEGLSPFSEIDDWIETLEMPYKFFENSFWLKGIYQQAQEDGVGVLLNGQRGNWTISWGPALEYQALLLKQMNFSRFMKELTLYSRKIGVRRSRILKHVHKKVFPFNKIQKRDVNAYPMIIHPIFAKRMKVYDRLKENKINTEGRITQSAYEVKKDQFNKLFYWNINGTYTTKLSLKHVLWDRDPTNDLRVVQFCLSVPEEQYVQNGQDRSLIRRATKNYLPDDIRLNQRTRGIQGADGLYRMSKSWSDFTEEARQMCKDSLITEFINVDVIKNALNNLGTHPESREVFNNDFRVLMRSIILYRFMKKQVVY